MNNKVGRLLVLLLIFGWEGFAPIKLFTSEQEALLWLKGFLP